ncbi:MAG: hypothetical protein K2L88_06795, partial [Clostridiales bacterium]|nr:hypothetical protein [Clostridiales bacterium]
ILIAVLLLLSAAICLLVALLPRMNRGSTTANASVTAGKTYYFLCTAETDERLSALASSQNAIERGGAGYVYNDGKYKIIAAVYNKETDVKTLVTVNANSFYFSLSLPSGEHKSGDKAVIEYLTGEWFDTLLTAATELDRANIKEAAAEHAVETACNRLRDLAYKANSEKLKNAITVCTYSPPQTQTVLSYIRYIHVQYVVATISALI